LHPDSPIESITRISAAYSKRLNHLGIKTIKDLLYHFPFRYDDLSKIVNISDVKINEVVTILGEIINIKTIRTFKKKMFLTEALLKDRTGTIRVVWYNQPFITKTFKKGTWISAAGKANFDGKTFHFSNPAYEKIDSPALQTPDTKHTGKIVPVYPETARLTSKWLRYILKLIAPQILPSIDDFLPPEIKKSQNFIELKTALEKIHFPKTQNDIDEARRRLGFDELFLIQLFMLEQKKKFQSQAAPQIKFQQELIKHFIASLPFKLTNAQRKATWEILQDIEKPRPMNRLLEGDVGSGKTIVAAIAALQTAKAGFQTAFMAPTEILANQHYNEISKILSGFNINIGLLTSADAKIFFGDSEKPISKMETSLSKKEAFKKIETGEIQIIIGTHSLIQDKIRYKGLGLVVIDEQHRFGVSQRQALTRGLNTDSSKNIPHSSASSQRESAFKPHFLSMTATPIPRTLTLTAYGDLDLSILDEMPEGRQKIITKVVKPSDRQKAYDFIRQQIKSGRQAFVICPRIEKANSEEQIADGKINDANIIRNIRKPFVEISETKTVTEEYKKLSEKIFPDLKIAMLHGKLKAKEKEKIMRDFKNNKTNVLVSTSVIEVGIDIPNAAVMMIEGSERFGLAQLYQFKGRVGRGEHQSYCFLFTESSSQTTWSRLKAIATAKNGFELAEKDLKIRGPGEFYGTRQWGLPDLTMASLSDTELIKTCRDEAEKLLSKDLELKSNPLLKEKLKNFRQGLHLE
jgi:ATP-dependent DNA helicase RecG